MSTSVKWPLLQLFCLFFVLSVVAQYDDLKPLGPAGKPTVNKQIHAFLNNNQIIPQQNLKIPDHLHDSLVDMSPVQNYNGECKTEGSGEFKFSLDPELPKPDFFVICLHNPAASEIISKIRMLLFNNTLLHPQIGKTRSLDSGFFSYPNMQNADYQNIFFNVNSSSETGKLFGDFSFSYLFHPLVPKRITTAIKDPKVIIILRNPIDRAYSQYLQLVSKQGELLSFETIVQQEFKELETIRASFRECFNDLSCKFSNCIPKGNVSRHNAEQISRKMETIKELRDYMRQSLLFRSIYDDMVERWLEVVDPQNIIVFFHEDFYYNPKSNMREIFNFLGVDAATDAMEDSWTFANYEDSELVWEPLNDRSYDTLVDFFAPFNDRLFAMINRADTDWKYHRTKIQK